MFRISICEPEEQVRILQISVIWLPHSYFLMFEQNYCVMIKKNYKINGSVEIREK